MARIMQIEISKDASEIPEADLLVSSLKMGERSEVGISHASVILAATFQIKLRIVTGGAKPL